MLERKRVAVLEEQQRRIQEALASRPIPSEDNLEMKAAMNAVGAMVDGDDEFGKSDEVNVDSQVSHLVSFPSLGKRHMFQGATINVNTGGMINIDLASQSTSTVFTLGMSGTSTIKVTTTMITHPQRLYKVTNSTYSTLILLTKQKLLFTYREGRGQCRDLHYKISCWAAL